MLKKCIHIIIIAVFAVILLNESVPAENEAAKSELSKKFSPTGALLRSAVVPGWGQFYTESYVKAAVIGSLETFLIYQTVYYWKRTSKYEDLYTGDTTETRASKYIQFDRYRDLRNQHLWFLGITIFYSMFDAYVDAHLKNFKIDLTPDFDSSGEDVAMWLTLKYQF